MFSRELEKYEVRYTDSNSGILRTRRFDTVEKAINFAREKIDRGVDADIKEINNLIGWY